MSLKPARHNFDIWRGATFRRTLEVSAGGVPWNALANYSSLLEIRNEPNVGEPIFTLSTSNGRIQTNAGTIELFISASDTAQIKWDAGVYDLLIIAPEGDTDALLHGAFRVRGV